jgi:hypothetical protein
MTATTLDQKTSRALIKRYGKGNLNTLEIALLKYLSTGCYWMGKKAFKTPIDFQVSAETISQNLGCARNTTLKIITDCEDLGLITVNRPEGERITYGLHVQSMKKWGTSDVYERRAKDARNNQKAHQHRMRTHNHKVETDPEYAALGFHSLVLA